MKEKKPKRKGHQESDNLVNRQSKIISVPLSKIKPSRWGTGIRDKEKYEALKESIKQRGLDDLPHVFPIGNGCYEPFIGDHRIMACKELGFKEVKCIVEDISEQEAMERCVGNNTTHSDYDSVRLENLVSEMWESGRYKAKADLGRAIGLSGQWVGLLIQAKGLREKAKLSYEVSSRCILDVNALKNEDDKIRLLELVKKNTIKPTDIKEYAKTLATISDDTRDKVLSGKMPLGSIANQKMTLPKKTVQTKSSVLNPNLLPELYGLMNQLQDHVGMIKEDDEKHREAINYVKFYTGLCLKILWMQGKIHEDFFKSVVRHELKIDEDKLHCFDGLRIKGIGWWSGDNDSGTPIDSLSLESEPKKPDSKKIISIDSLECLSCGTCEYICERKVFEMVDTKDQEKIARGETTLVVVVKNPGNCVGCGKCIPECPVGALSFKEQVTQ